MWKRYPIVVGLISAYIFYLLIDLLPRAKRERSILRVLNLLLTSVVDAYERTRIFGHETAIAVLDTDILKSQRLEQHFQVVRTLSVMFLKLKYAMETAHSHIVYGVFKSGQPYDLKLVLAR